MNVTKTNNLILSVEKTIDDHNLFAGVTRAIVGFSAGPDSVCLADVLHRLYRSDIEFELVYVNHGLRPERALKREETKARQYGSRYGWGYKIIGVKVSKKELGIEGAARMARHGALQDYASRTGAQRIVLGHNLDDFVETFLLNLLRGSGLRGLRSIPAKRLPFIRPLLDCRKEDILRYLRARHLSYVIDRSNLSSDHRRNFLRLKIIPMLQKINPDLHETIRREAEIFKRDDEYLSAMAKKVYDRTVMREKDCLLLDRAVLLRYNQPVAVRLVMKAIEELTGSLDGYESKHYHSVISLTNKEHGKIIDLPKGFYAQREPEKIVIGRTKERKGVTTLVDLSERLVAIGNYRLRFNVSKGPVRVRPRENREVFDLDELSLPLYVRNKVPGDKIETKIGRKKLKKVYSESRIVPRKRSDTLLLCDQRGVLWVIGFTRAHRGFVSEKTKDALVVDFEPIDQRN